MTNESTQLKEPKPADNRRSGLTKPEIEEIVELAVERAMNQTMQVTLPNVVHSAVVNAMANYEHECVLDLSARELEAAHVLIDVVRSVGDGDPVIGAETIRKNHNFVTKMRIRLDKAGDVVTARILTAVTSVLFGLLAFGLFFIFFVKNGGTPPVP